MSLTILGYDGLCAARPCCLTGSDENVVMRRLPLEALGGSGNSYAAFNSLPWNRRRWGALPHQSPEITQLLLQHRTRLSLLYTADLDVGTPKRWLLVESVSIYRRRSGPLMST